MQGIIRTPHASHILAARNASAITLLPHRLVALAAQDAASPTHEVPITTLFEAPAGKQTPYGVLLASLAVGRFGDVYRDGELMLESDGTAAIAVNDSLIPVIGASAAVSGRVTKLPSVLVSGTRYQIVARALSPAAATPGLLVRVVYELDEIVGAVAP